MHAGSVLRDLAGAFVVLVRLFYEPISATRSIIHRSRWWAPLVIASAIQMIVAAAWLQHADPFLIVMGDETMPVTFQSTDPDMAQHLRRWLLAGQAFRWGVIYPLGVASVGVVGFAGLSLFTGVPPALARCVSVSAHAFCAGDLARLLLGLLILALSSDWHLWPADTAVTSLSLLLDPASSTRLSGCVLGELDLLTFWKLSIVSVGLGMAAKISTQKAAALVLGAWAVYAAGKVWVVC